jgi:Ca2+-binding RTX toxin-like protein
MPTSRKGKNIMPHIEPGPGDHGGGGGHVDGGDTTTGELYGDLWVLTRDLDPSDGGGDGEPLLDENGQIVPIGYNPDIGETFPIYLVASEEEDYEVPAELLPFVQEVELERANIVRSPDQVLATALEEALAKIEGGTEITVEASGRIMVDGSLIDSPRENFALYDFIMGNGGARSWTEVLANAANPLVNELPQALVDLLASGWDPTGLLAGGFSKFNPVSMDAVITTHTLIDVNEVTVPADPDAPLQIDYFGFTDGTNETFNYDRVASYGDVWVQWFQDMDGDPSDLEAVQRTMLDAAWGSDNDGDGVNDVGSGVAWMDEYMALSADGMSYVMADGTGAGINDWAQSVEDARAAIYVLHESVGASEIAPPPDTDDVIDGSSYGDFISTWGGNDSVNALEGDDLVDGGDGNDSLNGGAGDDTVLGGNGNDVLYLGLGNDLGGGGAGDDLIFGGAGANAIYGGFGSDTVQGGTGSDTIFGGGDVGTNILLGNGGNDFIVTGSAGDLVGGGEGNDTIRGDAGNDTLYGSVGNDDVGGGAGNDTILTDVGDDIIYAGLGNDFIGGGAGNDLIFGGAGSNALYGGTGVDTVNGGTGDDTINGGGDGANRLLGNGGADNIIGGSGGELIGGGIGNDTLLGNDGADTIYAGAGNDFVGGGAGNDLLFGWAGADTIYAGLGDDLIGGGEGNDLIFAGAGNNQLYGGLGDDTVHAGAGQDVVNGGAGADVFVFGSVAQIGIGASRDGITDFSSGIDRIDVSALNSQFNGTSGLSGSGTSSFYHFAAGELLIGDADGNGVADWVLELTGTPTVVESDFIL